jgi:hypothetical protein
MQASAGGKRGKRRAGGGSVANFDGQRAGQPNRSRGGPACCSLDLDLGPGDGLSGCLGLQKPTLPWLMEARRPPMSPMTDDCAPVEWGTWLRAPFRPKTPIGLAGLRTQLPLILERHAGPPACRPSKQDLGAWHLAGPLAALLGERTLTPTNRGRRADRLRQPAAC